MKQSVALPAAAGSVYTTPAIELPALTSRGISAGQNDWIATAPALTTTELPNLKTVTYAIECDDAIGFGSVSTYADRVVVQTGVAGAGAAAVLARCGLAPSNTKRYWRLKVTTSAGAGNCSAKTASIQLHVVSDGPDLRA